MQVNCRKFHKYLGMKLEYTTVGKVKIAVLDYINEIPYAFDKAYPTGVSTKSSAAKAIFKNFDEDFKFFNSKQTVEFNHLVAEVLYATMWFMLDTCNTISFLTTRVR